MSQLPRDRGLAITKVHVPSLRMARVTRPGLEAGIQAALFDKKLTLLVAPAGFGKTSALVRGIAACGPSLQAIWISADAEDTLQRFLTALVLGGDALDLPWRMSVIGMMELAREEASGPARLGDFLAGTFAESGVARGLIAIDDAHRFADPAIFAVLERLVERLPGSWGVALSSREEPPVPLARRRLHREVAEFGPAELRFSREEFAALAASHDRLWSGADLDRVWTRVDGWPAGCELALQAGPARANAADAGGLAFNFLSSEVVDRLPEDLARFLTECAILPELREDICAAVTGSPVAGQMLRDILRRGLFVSDVGEGVPVLRLHDLFRDYLLVRLKASLNDAQVRNLYARAAQVEPTPERRIAYLLQAGALSAAEAALSEAANALLPEGQIARLMDLIHQFPAPTIEQSAVLSFNLGLCESCYPRWRETSLHMATAARLFEEAGQTDRANRARAYELVGSFGQAMTARAWEMLATLEALPRDAGTEALCAFAGYLLSRVGGTVDQEMGYFDRMLDALVAADDPVIWNQCGLHIYLGLQRGMRHRTERYATAALAVAGDRFEALRDSALSMRAWHCLLAGDMGRADGIIAELERSQSWNHKPYSVRGSILIARSLTVFFSGDAAALGVAAREFHAIFEGREGLSWAYWRGLTAVFFGKLHAAVGDWEAVAQALRQLDRELSLFDMPYLRLGRSYLQVLQCLHDDRPLPDNEALARLAQRPITADYLALEPALTAAQALVLAREGNREEAWRLLSGLVDELTRAEESFHLRLLGPVMLGDLAGIPGAGERYGPQRQTLRALAASFEEAGLRRTAQAGPDDFGLTAREIEVLDRIAAGDSNKVIARVLSVSPYTVKRHVANILGKLGLASRGQAAAWYREHGGG